MSGWRGDLVWKAARMGHHSYVTIGRRMFLFARDGYHAELAALFREDERAYLPADEDDDISRYGYFASAWQLRQRLHVQGFTAARALGDLREGIVRWRDAEANQPHRDGPEEVDRPSPPDADEFVEALRGVVADQPVFEGVDRDFDTDPEFADDERAARVGVVVDALWRYVDTRSLLRLLLDVAPGETEVGLDLRELTGCCVELDPEQPVAESARTTQLAAVSTNAPLIVLTEGSTDSRLLEKAMAITHPHLVGFIKFIDLAGVNGAEGGVGVLAKTVYAFIAAGVANRFVAIADNDTEGRDGFAKLMRESARLPVNCRVTHYPDLALLSHYPTVEAGSDGPVNADVNGRAGGLEMYLGRDVLTIDGTLAPVHLGNIHPVQGQHHGSLASRDKKAVQRAFVRKVRDARRNGRSPGSDWAGVEAIIEHIVHIFD
jgi:hypothetical protein